MGVWLYAADAEDFSGNGLGQLLPTECMATEQRNGMYDLEISHPLDEGGKWARIEQGCIIKAPVPIRTMPEIDVIGGAPDIVTAMEVWKATRDTKLYKSASTRSKKIKTIKQNATFTVTKKEGNWLKGRDKKGSCGWVPATAMEYIKDTITSDSTAGIEQAVPAASQRDQLFRIYSVERSMDGITAAARHISYDFGHNLISECKTTASAAAALGVMMDNLYDTPTDFEIYTDLTASKSIDWTRKNPVSAILDPETGFCAVYGAECVRDNYSWYLLSDAGMDRGYRIQYGKNLTGVDVEINSESVVTRIIPVGQTKDGKPLLLPEKYIDSPRISQYPVITCIALEVSDAKIGIKKENGKELTSSDAYELMRNAAKDEFNKGADLPEISVQVDFEDLGNTREYSQFQGLQQVFLHDTIRVLHPDLGVDIQARVVSATWDCLASRYTGMEIGSERVNLATNGISSWQIPTGGVNGSKLVMGSVGSGQLGDGAIAADHIQADSIVAGKIAAGAVTAGTIAAGAVTAGNIAAGAVTAGTIAAGAVNAVTIEAGSITADQLKAGLITADSGLIDTGAIGTAQIADGSITDAKIVELTANKITSGTLDASKVTVNNLVADNITTGTLNGQVIPQLGTDKIQDGAVTGDKVGKNAITADKIVSAAVTTGKLAAAAVTANKIAAGAIDAGKITAGAVNADKIAADSVEGRHVKAGAITTDKLHVGDMTNLLIDPGFENSDLSKQQYVTTTEQARTGKKSLKIGTGITNWLSLNLRHQPLEVKKNERLYVEWWAMRAGGDKPINISIRIDGYDGQVTYNIPGRISAPPDAPDGQWIRYSYVATCDRDGVALIRAGYDSAQTMTGDWYMDDVLVRRVVTALDNGNSVEISPENGIVVTQGGLKTQFRANARQFGVYDGNNVMLAGAGYDANTKKGYFAAKQIRNTSKNSAFRMEMMDENMDGADTGGEGLGCYLGTLLLGGLFAGQAVWSGGTSGGETSYLRLWAAQLMELASEGPMNFMAKGAANYDAAEGHNFTGGSIVSQNHVRPEGNGTANCGLPNNRWRYIYSQNQLNVSSDARVKRDIAPIENAKALIMGLRPRQYRLRSDGANAKGVSATAPAERTAENEAAAGNDVQNNFQQKHLAARSSRANAEGVSAAAPAERTALHTGFVAQHVKRLAPDWAAVDDSDPDNLGMMYGEILAPLVQVVQDQQREIEELQRRVRALEGGVRE